MRRDEALRVLGLGPGGDGRAVRRRFRELARERHPDRGGDPAAFAELRRAYAVLRAAPAPHRPAVSRGRPSRTPDAPAAAAPEADAEALAAALAARATADGTARLRLVSVAPGARRNRLAAALPEGSIGVLELRTGGGGTGDGADGVEVRLSARGRAARRAVSRLALDGAGLGGTWRRRRVDAAVELRAAPVPRAATAAARAGAAAEAAARLLAALDWPAAEWTPDA